MKDNEFKCYQCEGIFQKGLTDREAEEQLGEEFPGHKPQECKLVCNDCYKKMF